MEKSLILLKPGFVSDERKIKIKNFLNENDLKILIEKSKDYTIDEARRHYVNKSDEAFYNDLTDYLTSGQTYGYVVYGDDAIRKTRLLVKDLRRESKDVMRNVCHGTNKTDVDGRLTDIDSEREIKIFLNER